MPENKSKVPLLALSSAALGIAFWRFLTRRDAPSAAERILKPVSFRWSMTVPKSPEEAWFLWSKMDHLPAVVPGLLEVRMVDEMHHDWIFHDAQWRSVIVDDEPGRRIAWKVQPGSLVLGRGELQFHSRRNGTATEVRFDLWYFVVPEEAVPREQQATAPAPVVMPIPVKWAAASQAEHHASEEAKRRFQTTS